MNNNKMKGIWIPFEILNMNLSAIEKMVLSIYRNYTFEGSYGCCTMTNDDIADMLGCDVKTIKRAKKRFEELGYITRSGIKVVYIKQGQNVPQVGTKCPPKQGQNVPHIKEDKRNIKDINNSTYNKGTYNRSVETDIVDEVTDGEVFKNPNLDLGILDTNMEEVSDNTVYKNPIPFEDGTYTKSEKYEYDSEVTIKDRVKRILKDIEDGVFYSKCMLEKRMELEYTGGYYYFVLDEWNKWNRKQHIPSGREHRRLG